MIENNFEQIAFRLGKIETLNELVTLLEEKEISREEIIFRAKSIKQKITEKILELEQKRIFGA